MESKSMSWGELALLTHATQVAEFDFCTCEEQEQFPYSDCPRESLVGAELANGALCIDSKPIVYKGNQEPSFIVLAFRAKSYDPYVVWSANNQGECWKGSYFNTLASAVQEFDRRIS